MSALDDLPLSRKQITSIVESRRYRVSIWSGAVRSGKTIASILAFYDAIHRAPGSGLIIIVGRTLQTIERNILEPMQDENVFGDWANEVHHTRGSNTAVILGRTVHLIGASDVRAEGKLRGMTACLALVDEATLLPESFWTQLLARLSVPGARCLATTNPDNPNHFLKVNFIDRADDPEMNLRTWNFTLDDNPSLAPEYIAAIKAEFTGLFYLRNILGRWVAADGAIFDMFDPDQHVVPWDDLPNMQWMIGVGVDHGTTNPTHAVLVGLGTDDVLYAIDEWRHKSTSNEARWTNVQLSQGLRDWLAGPHHPSDDPGNPPRLTCPVHVDQAAADYRVQLKQDGLTTYPAAKDVLYGIRTLTALMSAGKLKFSDRCPELLKEIPGYVWDTKATETGKDQPIKLNDHGCFVAGTMVETAIGPRPIETIRVGDLVWTRFGLRRVKDSGCTGVLPVHTVEFSDGTLLTGTANHPVFVDGKGFTRIDDLRYADRIISCRNALKSQSSKVSNSGAIPMQRPTLTRSTTRPESATSNTDGNVSTKKSGWMRTASTRYPRGITSTMWITIRQIMTRPIWNAFQRRNTTPTTVKSSGTIRSEWPGSGRTSTLSVISPRRGIEAMKAEPGTVNTRVKSGKTGSPRLPYVTSAEASSSRLFPDGSAPTTVSLHGDEHPASTTSIVSARIAEWSSESTDIGRPPAAPVSVVGVSAQLNARPVYNLTVDGQPEYFASGVLVHNCDALRYAITSTERKWRRRVKLALDFSPRENHDKAA